MNCRPWACAGLPVGTAGSGGGGLRSGHLVSLAKGDVLGDGPPTLGFAATGAAASSFLGRVGRLALGHADLTAGSPWYEVSDMSDRTESFSDRNTIPLLQRWPRHRHQRVMTTAYDGVTARLPDSVVDLLLVGGQRRSYLPRLRHTLPVSMATMNHRHETVARTRPVLRNHRARLRAPLAVSRALPPHRRRSAPKSQARW
ncbi:3-methyl-2-oxobutanoate hydroxymethyltransferase [Microvirga vignae]|uniref:3-methyl-2-oxobutanoate hydroxymethyltransferase n=1 Tax=Microvirga vignae TaxID=1225564 RepID=UPI000A004253